LTIVYTSTQATINLLAGFPLSTYGRPIDHLAVTVGHTFPVDTHFAAVTLTVGEAYSKLFIHTPGQAPVTHLLTHLRFWTITVFNTVCTSFLLTKHWNRAVSVKDADRRILTLSINYNLPSLTRPTILVRAL
jgi:hypothetical protein